MVKTPGRRALAVASAAVAETLAAEWAGQGERIDPATMPLTRIVNTAIDHVADEMAGVRTEITKYAGSDLICYRAEAPRRLPTGGRGVDPLVRWARDTLGAPLVIAAGVVHVAQPETALAAIERAVAPFDPLNLAALSTVTTLTGSAIIALAVARRHLSAEEAWVAALIDENWEIDQWGKDEAAMTGAGLPAGGRMAAAGWPANKRSRLAQCRLRSPRHAVELAEEARAFLLREARIGALDVAGLAKVLVEAAHRERHADRAGCEGPSVRSEHVGAFGDDAPRQFGMSAVAPPTRRGERARKSSRRRRRRFSEQRDTCVTIGAGAPPPFRPSSPPPVSLPPFPLPPSPGGRPPR